jgi:hypothetical protein
VSALSLPLLLAFVAPATDPGAAPTSTAPPAETAPATPSDVAPVPEPAPDPMPTSAPAPEPAPAPAPALTGPVVTTAPAPAAPPVKTKPPGSHGPFFVGESPSDTNFPNGPRVGDPPRLSVGKGAFCFVEDSFCKASLLLTADVGIGVNLVGGTGAPDLPYAQFTFRGGLAIKPLMLGARASGWHPWGIGLIGGWSRGTGPSRGDKNDVPLHVTTTRVMLVNQLWLTKKRNGFHLDLDVGVIRSSVRDEDGRFFGTAASLSANWGGWGGLFMNADLLDHDTRLVFGFRGHGLATGPAIGLILLGLLAGGAFGGAS